MQLHSSGVTPALPILCSFVERLTLRCEVIAGVTQQDPSFVSTTPIYHSGCSEPSSGALPDFKMGAESLLSRRDSLRRPSGDCCLLIWCCRNLRGIVTCLERWHLGLLILDVSCPTAWLELPVASDLCETPANSKLHMAPHLYVLQGFFICIVYVCGVCV